jgi:S1-C subfamily serine protease
VLISSPTSAFGSPAAGAAVGGVVAGGPAGQAGLAAGDVITSLGGRAVPTPAALSRLMAQEQPGRTVQIGWTDPEGASHTAPVTLQSGPPA